MPGKRTIKKRQLRRPPKVEKTEADDFDNFDSVPQHTKQLRRRFAQEYIKDFNATQAVLRMGYKYARTTAQTKGSQWLKEAYTQHIVAELMEKADEASIVTRNEVLFGLKREAHNDFNSGAERISAFRTLAKALGMEVVKADINMTVDGGVMTIPLSGAPEDWEKAASVAQKALKAAVRE